MESITVTRARQNLYKLISDVNENHTPIQISSKKGDCILISVDDWKAIIETQYLNAVPGMTESILQGSKSPLKDCIPLKDVEW